MELKHKGRSCVLDLVPREVFVPYQSPSGSMYPTYHNPGTKAYLRISSLAVIGMSNFGVEKKVF